ncbi:hypothetical protein LINPERHAP1_LOCUS22928 [Linum perenne]
MANPTSMVFENWNQVDLGNLMAFDLHHNVISTPSRLVFLCQSEIVCMS